ncbi:hypothetical protein VNO77_39429 [Canavalia gladiata]|uniref:Peptidase A1 domain-containing protein n=1 Tax=Canavalia gladiata TaxID=3824 RepID=A0AAN9KD33_CANGL
MLRYSCLAFLLLCLYRIYLSESVSDGFSVEIIHRDSSISPFYNPQETKFQRVVNALRRSINGGNHFASPNSGEATVTPDRGAYLMSYSIGTPPFQLYGILDTGDLSVETLTLDSTGGSTIKFPKTVVGCGTDNTVSFQGKSSGIIGFGGGPVSFMSQLRASIGGGSFSYCLTPMFPESNSSSKLNFGDAAMVSGRGTVSTPIVEHDQQIFYYLTLEAFSVGKNRIEFGDSSFGSVGDGNIIIDSGTTLTLLPNDLYSRFESAVAEKIKLKRVDDPTQLLNLCYDITSDELDVPVITAHFSGADVQLNAINTFVEVAKGVSCLAFTSTENIPIFGNLAQQNLLVGYDLKNNILSFKPTDCTRQ